MEALGRAIRLNRLRGLKKFRIDCRIFAEVIL